MKPRLLSSLAWGFSAVLVLSACSGQPGTTQPLASTAAPVILGGRITIGATEETIGLVGSGPKSGASVGYLYQMAYDPLVEFDNKTGAFVPVLATSVTNNPDFTEWTFKLRSGVKFSSGTEMTAQSIKDNVDKYWNAADSIVLGEWVDVKEVVVVDPLTVKFVLKGPVATFPELLAHKRHQPFNPDIRAKYGDQYPTHPDGAGPFYLASYEPNSRMLFKKNPYYWRKDAAGRQLPYLDEIEVRPILNNETRIAGLQSGQLDVIMALDPTTVTQASQLSGMQLATYVGNQGTGMYFNVTKAPVDDLRVRQALAYGIDKAAMLAAGGTPKDYLPVCTQMYTPESRWYSTKAAEAAPTYDPTKAKTFFDAYKNDAARSDRKPVGSPVAVNFVIENDAVSLAWAQVAQANAKQLGFDATIRPLAANAKKKEVVDGNYDITFQNFPDLPPYRQAVHSWSESPKSSTNWSHWNDPTVLAAARTLKQTADTAKIKALTEEIALSVNRNLPVVFITYRSNSFIYRTSRIPTFVLEPLGESGAVDWAELQAR